MVNSRHARVSGLAMGIRSVSACLHVIVTGAFFPVDCTRPDYPGILVRRCSVRARPF